MSHQEDLRPMVVTTVIVVSPDLHPVRSILYPTEYVLNSQGVVMERKHGKSGLIGAGRHRLLTMFLAFSSLAGISNANAALLELTGGVWQTTPAQVPGNVTAGNDVITSPVNFWDNATLTTTEAVVLTFYYVGAESGYTNTLHVTGGGAHAETSIYPGNWNNPALFSISLGANQPIPLSFTSSGFALSLAPGGGTPQGNGNFDRSIGFSILNCTTGSAACFSSDPDLRSGNILAFLLDDGGASQDDNHDDYVGFMVATTPVPLPATAWLLLSGAGLLGAAGRRRKA